MWAMMVAYVSSGAHLLELTSLLLELRLQFIFGVLLLLLYIVYVHVCLLCMCGEQSMTVAYVSSGAHLLELTSLLLELRLQLIFGVLLLLRAFLLLLESALLRGNHRLQRRQTLSQE